MDAILPSPPILREPHGVPFEIRRSVVHPPGPLIFASPHSGRLYPEQMMAASALDAGQIRRSEDAHVDALVAGGLDHGAVILLNRYARAYVDVNREPYELDPTMFEDELPAFARGRSARVAAGLGAIARIVGDGQEIYNRKLTFAEARDRIDGVHKPYHEALRGLIDDALESSGQAVVIDWHSMPSAAAYTPQRGPCDFVLGDRYGRSCKGDLTDRVETFLTGRGYRVVRNNPYAGGYTTEHYGRPTTGVDALQIEISRALYLDEATLATSSGFAALRDDLESLFAVLAAPRTR